MGKLMQLVHLENYVDVVMENDGYVGGSINRFKGEAGGCNVSQSQGHFDIAK